MFDKDLIPHEPSQGLQAGYTIRPLEIRDYDGGVLEVLKVLTTVGDIPKEAFIEQLNYWEKLGDTYYPIVITNNEENVVASGMLVVERKLIHERGLVGHIEDIAVAQNQQGLKLGKRLIQALSGIARKVGCYKVILDCDPKNVGFYEKCGYSKAGVEMQIRY